MLKNDVTLLCLGLMPIRNNFVKKHGDITFMCACHALKTSKHAKSAINCIKSEKKQY